MNLKKFNKIILLIVLFLMIGMVSVNASVEKVLNFTFDSEAYANGYNDLRVAYGTDANKLKEHFANYGVREGRVASPVFDVKYYVAQYSDLQQAYGTDYEKAYNHFINYGMKEGRRTSPMFDVRYYVAQYADLQQAYGTEYEKAFEHFANYGMAEGRKTSANFDVRFYVGYYADLQQAYGTNYEKVFNHYLNYGMAEGRITVAPQVPEKPEHTHSYDAGVVTTEPTCTTTGVKTYTCTECKATKTEELPVVEHSYDAGVVTTEPTCTTTGVKTYTCTECKATKTEELPALEHDYVAVEGEDQFTYTVNEDETVSAKLNLVCTHNAEHKSTVDATVVEGEKEPATCEDAGSIECEATATYQDKEYTNSKTVILPQKDHEYTKQVALTATCEKEGTYYNACKYCGKEEMKKNSAGVDTDTVNIQTGKLAHNYDKLTESKVADCTHGGYELYTCSMCGKATQTINLTDKKPHDFDYEGAKTEAKAATCTEAGNPEYYTCKTCGFHYSDDQGTTKLEDKDLVIPATTHDYTAKVTENATCTTAGVRTYTCSKCEDKYTEAIAATNHANKAVVDAKAATCGEKGNVEYEKCSDCNKYFATANSNIAGKNAGEEITLTETETPATGSHTYGNWIVTQEATSDKCQERYHKCTVCGKKETDTAGHTAGAVTPATCTTPEMTMCTKCGKKYQTAPANNHSWTGKVTVTTPATCTTAGSKTTECANCNEVKTEEIPATGHTLVDHADTAENCTATVNKANTTCTVCKKYFVEDENGNILNKNDGTTTTLKYKEVAEKEVIIPATDHKWDAGVVSAVDASDTEAEAADKCQKRTYTCTNKGCNATRKEFIAHNLKEVAAKDATCTEKGNIAHFTCNQDGEFYRLATNDDVATVTIDNVQYVKITEADTEVAAKGHTFSTATILDTVVPATPAADIANVRVSFRCGICGDSVVETVTLNYVAATATMAEHYTTTTTQANVKTFYFDANLKATTEEALTIE